jgi:hypothetical protein
LLAKTTKAHLKLSIDYRGFAFEKQRLTLYVIAMTTDTLSDTFWQRYDATTSRLRPLERISPVLGVPRPLVLPPQDQSPSMAEQQITYQELISKSKQQSVAFVGAPGSGKSTLMVECTRDLSKELGYLPLFIPLAALHAVANLEGFVAGTLPPGNKLELLTSIQCVIAWDGINELRTADTDNLYDRLLEFQSQYPQHRYLLSTWVSNMPARLGRDFLEVHVLPLPVRTVDKSLQTHFAQIVGPNNSPRYSAEGFQNLVVLCQLPMIYEIVLSLLQDENVDHDTLVQLCAQRQKYKLYGNFLAKLSRDSEPKGGLQEWPSMKAHVLNHLAYNMVLQKSAFVSEDWIEDNLREILTSRPFRKRFPDFPLQSLGNIISLIMKSPPLQAIHVSQIGRPEFGFIHQSFGEYCAGRFLESGLHAHHNPKSDSAVNPELDCLLDDTSRRDWEVVRFAAASPEGHPTFVEYLSDYAVRNRRQDLLTLAAQCVPLIANATANLAADLQVRMLDAFKNWEKPFDYDLLYELGELASQNGGDSRISCVQSQIGRYVQLYCPRKPVRLRYWSRTDLEQLVFSCDEVEAVNAIYTLGTFPAAAAESISDFIIKYYNGLSPSVREQALATLKDLRVSRNAHFFLNVLKDSSATVRCKVIALNGIAVLGIIDYISDLIQYYTDSANPHRDSAGWSLQMLGRVAHNYGRTDILDNIKRVFWRKVEEEADIGEGEYIKANVFYSLGIFKAREYIDQMIGWGRSAKFVSPLVLEDLIYGLALMADQKDKRSAEFVSEHLAHKDPAVRLKAVYAIGLFRYKEARGRIRAMKKTDDFKVVRYMASESDRQLR